MTFEHFLREKLKYVHLNLQNSTKRKQVAAELKNQTKD